MVENRHSEIDDELINHLKSLPKEQVQQAVKELKKPTPKKMVRGTRRNQLSLPVTIQTQDMVSQFRVIGLVDSGCTGSCIDIGLVQRQKILTQKLPVPQPAYNTDGTLNAAGRITEFVDVRMTIMDHLERIPVVAPLKSNGSMAQPVNKRLQ